MNYYMNNVMNKAFYLCPIIFFSCASESRLEFCECMDLKKAFTDQYTLSKNEIEEKQKGCLWIENELSQVEITQKTLECWKSNGAEYDTLSTSSSDSINDINLPNELDIPEMGRAKCISEFTYVYSSPDNNSITENYFTINDILLYRYDANDNGFLKIYQVNEDGTTNYVGYCLNSDFDSFEDYAFPLPRLW